MTSSQQYSPAQILGMGQQAESEGNFDYALKVYAYLIHYFPETAEAEASRSGQARIAAWQRSDYSQPAGQQQPSETGQSVRPPPLSHSPMHYASQGQAPVSQSAAQPQQNYQQDGSAGGWSSAHSYEQTRTEPYSKPSSFATSNAEQSRQAVTYPSSEPSHPATGVVGLSPSEPALPRLVAAEHEPDEFEDLDFLPARKYVLGSYLATAIGVFGWLFMAAGVALILLGFSGVFPALSQAGPLGLHLGLEAGMAVIAFGVALVFVGQIAHAVFDNANANQALLAIQRDHGHY